MPRVLALRALLVLTAILALPCSSAAAAPPPGDSFSAPAALTGADATAEIDTTEATQEPGEPMINNRQPQGTIWISWTAPADGMVGVDTVGSSFDTIVGVYTGDSIDQLNQIAWDDDANGITRISRPQFAATAGTTYRILAGGTASRERGALKLTLRQRQAPANDAFTSATLLPSERAVTAGGDSLAATSETGEPAHYPYLTQAKRSVWYTWTAPAKGSLKIRASRQPGLYHLVAVYSGDTLTSLERVRNQPQLIETYDDIRVRVEAGVTYRIAVDGYTKGGEFQLSLEFADTPTNDDFADSLLLEGDSVDTSGTTQNATTEECEPVHEDNYWDPSVWYHWTATRDGGVVLDSTGSGFPTVLAVYTGTDLCSLTRVQSRRLSSGGPEKRSFRAKAGQTYRIALDGARVSMGNYSLSLRWTPPPPNDMRANAERMSGDTATATGTTLGATREPDEAGYGMEGASVWYSWTASSNGEARFTLGPYTHLDARIYVYARGPAGELKSVSAYSGYGFKATAGTEYLVSVDTGIRTNHVDFTLDLVHRPSPPNDDFATATPLVGSDATASGTNAGATYESGEPSPADERGRGSVWFRWTAPSDGTVAIDTEGSQIDSVLGVYTGAAVNQLTSVATNNNVSSTKKTSRVTFRATAGTTYHVLLDSYYDVRGEYQLRLGHRTRPPNDNFVNAAPLPSAAAATTLGSNLGATAETGEPSHLNYYSTPTASVWYSWTAPSSGSLTVRATPGNYQPVLAAYTGSTVTSLSRVQNQPQDWNGGPEQIRLAVRAGTTYYIAVDASGSLGGDFTLSLDLIASPANDDFANAWQLSGDAADAEGSTVGATQEPCEPVHDSNYYDPSVWFTWTAPATGAVTLDSAGSDFPTVLAAYTGDTLCSLIRQPLRIMNATGERAKRGFRAIAGRTYRIVVDGLHGKWGNYKLSLRLAPPPANDMLADAQELTGAVAETSGSNFGATAEVGEPGGTNGATVWYRWTAPHTGLTRVEMPSAFGHDAGLSVYTGDAPQALVTHGSNYNHSHDGVNFRAEQGRTYKIRVDGGSLPLQGDFSLKLTSLPAPANDDFARSEPLSGATGRLESTTAGATFEQGEPEHSDYRDYRGSVWYTWTAPETGLVEFATTGTTSAWTQISAHAYSGDSLQTLRYLGTRSFRAERGQTYRIAVAGAETVGNGGFGLAWRIIGPPANDAWEDAALVEGASITRHGTTVGATMQTGEPASTAYYSDGGATVWYRWTAPSTGLVALSISGGNVDAYEGSGLASLQRIASSRNSQGYFRAEAGSTYYFRAEGPLHATSGSFSMYVRLVDRPANDDFADAAILGGAASGTTTGATSERGEPLHGGRRATVWYRWTPDRTGTAVIGAASYDHAVAVYRGDSLDTLELRASRSGGKVRTRVVAGTTYRIAVSGEPTSYARPFTLTTEILSGPANDDFADATQLTGVEDRRLDDSSLNATLEPGEPRAGYGYYDSDDSTIWYRWTAPTSGRVTVSLNGSDFNTTLAAFTGSSLRTLKRVGADNDSGMHGASVLGVTVRAGETLHFSVGSYSGAGGRVSLKLSHQSAPANDDLAGATPLSGSVVVTGDNTAATVEPGEPKHNEYEPAHHSLWYAWTAPSNGRVTLDISNSQNSPYVAVYDGATIDSLKQIKRNYWSDKKVTFDARRGTTYRIALDTYSSRRGPVSMSITHVPAPPNDDLAEAQPLAGGSTTVPGTTSAATREPGEYQEHSSYRGTVWYRWTSPGTGRVRIAVRDTSSAPLVDVYTGTGGFAGQRVGGGYMGAHFDAVKGATYVFSVHGQTPPEGPFTLELNLQEPPPNDRFADAQTLTGPVVDVGGTTVHSTREYCEPQHDADHYDTSVWYSWTAPADGTATVDVVGTGFTPTFGVYTGDTLCGLAGVAFTTSGNRHAFTAVAGRTYRLAVDSASGATGPFSLSLRSPVAPAQEQEQAPLTQQHSAEGDGGDPPSNPPSGAPADDPPADDPPTGDSTFEKSTDDPPAGGDPGTDDPPAGDPAGTGPGSEEPPSGDPSPTDPPAGDSGSEDPPSEDPPAGDPFPIEPPLDPPAQEEPAEQPPAEQSPSQEPPADDPPSEEPPAEPAPAEDPPADQSGDGDFPIDNPLDSEDPPAGEPGPEPAAGESPSEDPPAADPPADDQAAGDPPSDGPSADEPDENDLSNEGPASVDPPNEAPSGGDSSTGDPATEDPAEDPSTGDPATEDPAEDPSTGNPAAGNPSTGDPSTGDPPGEGAPDDPTGDTSPSPDAGDPVPSAGDPAPSAPPSGDQTDTPPAGEPAPSDPPSPPGGTSPGAADPDPFDLTAAFSPKQRIGSVLSKGLAGTVACTTGCLVEVIVTVDAAAAKRAKLTGSKLTQARMAVTLARGASKNLAVRLPKAAHRKLRGMKLLPLTVRVVATSPAGRAERTLRLKLKR